MALLSIFCAPKKPLYKLRLIHSHILTLCFVSWSSIIMLVLIWWPTSASETTTTSSSSATEWEASSTTPTASHTKAAEDLCHHGHWVCGASTTPSWDIYSLLLHRKLATSEKRICVAKSILSSLKCLKLNIAKPKIEIEFIWLLTLEVDESLYF